MGEEVSDSAADDHAEQQACTGLGTEQECRPAYEPCGESDRVVPACRATRSVC